MTIQHPVTEGYAAKRITGGLGRPIIKVTSLADSGAGTLRAALSLARTNGGGLVVFEVGGAINLASPLRIEASNLTIAGETAPDPGINIQRERLVVAGPSGQAIENVIIRHLRARLGDANYQANADQGDTITLLGVTAGDRPVRKIWIDHCDFLWSLDELMSVYYGPQSDISITNCLIGPALNSPFVNDPDDTVHAYGPVVGTGATLTPRLDRIDFQKNLFYSCMQRSPRFNEKTSGLIANNVAFGWQANCMELRTQDGTTVLGPAYLSVIGNLCIPSAQTPVSGRPILMISTASHPDSRVYFAGNTAVSPALNQIKWNSNGAGAPLPGVVVSQPPVQTRFEGLRVPAPIPPAALEEEVGLNVGARPKNRDALATRVIDNFKNRVAEYPASQTAMGGYPTYTQATRALTPPAATDTAAVQAWLDGFERQVSYELDGAAAGATYATDFSDVPVGQAPADFVKIASFHGGTYAAVEDASAVGGRILRDTDPTVKRKHRAWTDVPDARDVEVLTRVRVGAGALSAPCGVLLRWSHDGTDENGYYATLLNEGTASLRLAKYVGNVYANIRDVAFPWSPETWIWIRFRAIGSSLKVRAWAEGGAEPTAWTIEATDASHGGAGRVGLYSFDGARHDFDLLSVGLNGAAAPRPGRTYATGFADTALGSAPAAFVKPVTFYGGAFAAASDASASDGRILSDTEAAVKRKHRIWTAVPAARDAEVLVKVRAGSGATSAPCGAILRFTTPTSAGSESCYYATLLDEGVPSLRIAKYVAGDYANVRDATFSWSQGAWFWIRFRAEAASLKARAWADGAPEPAAWTVEATDASIPGAGQVGLYSFDATRHDFDRVAAALDGATAPLA